jgi:hypothetical protein
MSEEVRSGIREDFMKSKFFGHALDEATAKTKNQHVIQYISYWRRGRVLRKFWGIVPITAQDAKTIYEADKASLLYLTDGDEVVLHKGHMGMGGDGASVISGGNTGVGARYKEKVVIAILRCSQTQLCPSMRCTRSWCGSVAGEGGESLMRTCMKFLSWMTDSLRKLLPDLVILIEIEGVQWLETATCERGFSLRTQILTAQRYSMGDSLLACLMMICSNGPSLHEKEEVEKFLLAVVARFKAFKKRVPSNSCGGKRPQRASASKAKSSVLSQLSGLENVVFNDFIDEELDSEDVSEQRASASLPDSVPIESEEERAAREADEMAALDSVGDYEADPNVMLEDVPQDIVIKTLKVSCACVPVLVFACVCVCACARRRYVFVRICICIF